MNILTNDPSTDAWGWAVVKLDNGHEFISDSGCIKTRPTPKKVKLRKSDDRVRRFKELSAELQNIYKIYDIDWVLAELPHGSQNASAAVMIGAVAGILATYSTCNNLPIEWYSEGDAKKHLLNRRSASKKQTIDCIIRHYGNSWVTGTKYIDEAVADALSIYHIAKSESPALMYALNSTTNSKMTRKK